MKFTISALLVVAALCADMTLAASPAPSAPSRNTGKPHIRKPPARNQGVATLTYADDTCSGVLTQVSVEAHREEGDSSCNMACTNGIVQKCVSGDSNEYELYVMEQFKEAPIVLSQKFGPDDVKCTDKVQRVSGILADGKCYKRASTTINPNGTVTTNLFYDDGCLGEPVQDFSWTETYNGECKFGEKNQVLNNPLK